MSQKSSDPQAISFVSQPLKRDNYGHSVHKREMILDCERVGEGDGQAIGAVRLSQGHNVGIIL